MSAARLDGSACAEAIRAGARRDLEELVASGCTPELALFRVGDHPAALGRQAGLTRAAAAWGIEAREVVIPGGVRPREIARRLRALGRDKTATGIVLLQPLPEGVPTHEVLDTLAPAKDVEGIHPETIGRALRRRPGPVPTLAGAVLALLRPADVVLDGARVALVGPATGDLEACAALLVQRGAVATLCPWAAPALDAVCREADVLVVQANRPGLIGADAVKDGAVVLDAGVNAVSLDEGRLELVGDVDAAAVRSRASALTPVPGGVGPVQTAVLLRNLVALATGPPAESDPSQLPLFA